MIYMMCLLCVGVCHPLYIYTSLELETRNKQQPTSNSTSRLDQFQRQTAKPSELQTSELQTSKRSITKQHFRACARLFRLLDKLRQRLRCRAPARNVFQIHRQQRYEAHSAAQCDHALAEAMNTSVSIAHSGNKHSMHRFKKK